MKPTIAAEAPVPAAASPKVILPTIGVSHLTFRAEPVVIENLPSLLAFTYRSGEEMLFNSYRDPFRGLFYQFNEPPPFAGAHGRRLFQSGTTPDDIHVCVDPSALHPTYRHEPIGDCYVAAYSHFDPFDSYCYISLGIIDNVDGSNKGDFITATVSDADKEKAKQFCLHLLLDKGLIDTKNAHEAGYTPNHEGVRLARKQLEQMNSIQNTLA